MHEYWNECIYGRGCLRHALDTVQCTLYSVCASLAKTALNWQKVISISYVLSESHCNTACCILCTLYISKAQFFWFFQYSIYYMMTMMKNFFCQLKKKNRTHYLGCRFSFIILIAHLTYYFNILMSYYILNFVTTVILIWEN